MYKPMGIRLKLTLLLCGLLLPCLGAGGLFNIAQMKDTLMEEMRNRGLGLMSTLAVPCSIALANNEIERLDDYLARLSGLRDDSRQVASDPVQDLRFLSVVDPHGRVVAHTLETAFGTVRTDEFARRALVANVPLFEEREGPNGPVMSMSLPVVSGLRWGTLLAEFSLRRLKQRIATLRLQTLAATLALTLLALLALSLGLFRLVVRPVKALSVMAGHLAEGKLNHRVRVDTRDELGMLAEAFNLTAEELTEYTQDLERKIRERSQEIVEKNEQLERANRRLAELATTDQLTSLANKAHWLTRLEFEVLRAKRGGHRLCLLMLDVDHFKHYNDTHGHLAGDRLLSQLAALLRQELRATDIAGRFGGEEFGMVLMDTRLRSAANVANKIRKAVELADFAGQDRQPGGNLTVSIGAAELNLKTDDKEDLIEKADQALYRAKEQGRNQVVTA